MDWGKEEKKITEEGKTDWGSLGCNKKKRANGCEV